MYRIAICDDDKIICKAIELWLRQYEAIHNETFDIHLFFNANDLLTCIETDAPFNLIFLDVHLDLISGIDIARQIRKNEVSLFTMIVFISGLPPQTETLFDPTPIGYLLKPFRAEDVIEMLEKAMALIESKPSFLFKMGSEYCNIYYEKICYIQKTHHKIQLITMNDAYEFYGALCDIELEFLKQNFIKIHQSILINPNYIELYRQERVTMMNGSILPISKKYQAEVRTLISSGYEDLKKIRG